MSRFLWSGSDKSSGIKVKWEEICKPLNEGGMGLNQLKIWNKALMLRHIWDIFCRKYSLWISPGTFDKIKSEIFLVDSDTC